MPKARKIVSEALEAAKLEGFANAENWREDELLIWYKSLLVWENKTVPKALRGILIDIGDQGYG